MHFRMNSPDFGLHTLVYTIITAYIFTNFAIDYDESRTPPPEYIPDRGNVRVVEIDGPVVRLELEGACGSCPSSTMTMKMGLERRLVQKIPEISEVVQSIPNGPELNVSCFFLGGKG